ncbi:MAG TPA: MarR family winged helix-turn-helix transcriptional regulator [Candidatus Saccharimonadales bacterium]|jgi:DNA-binding MarR family transcriptional regulator|nr:MarR family winged helix-turn-helix transcriptional regulator [Candidatus Saccharimonadales bacterium]
MKKTGNAGPTPKLKKRFQRLASYRLHRLAGLSDRFIELRYRRKFGLRTPEVGIVAVVGASSPLSFKMTCIETNLEKSKVSRVVAQLLKKGLLKKREDPADQRSFRLTLTAAGKKLYWAMYADAVARNEQWIAVLPKKQRAQFVASLERLTQHSQKLLEEEEEEEEEGKASATARRTRSV